MDLNQTNIECIAYFLHFCILQFFSIGFFNCVINVFKALIGAVVFVISLPENVMNAMQQSNCKNITILLYKIH